MSLLAALFVSGTALAQSGRITGTVTAAEGGRAVPSAVVTVNGTNARTVTGPDGSYTINGVAPGPRQVTASVIGFAPSTRSVTVAAGEAATVNFQLQASAVALEGLVAIGYGQQRVRDNTGSVQAVTAEEFNTGRVVSAEQLIQGKVAGVQVIDSGEPGGGINLRIRGGSSVTSNNEPLYVVDGVPLDIGGGISAGRNPLNFLNPQDIASVNVLKDASATAIYGSRGANGVVIIETKRGTRGAPQFTYTTSVSNSVVTGEPNLLTADQYRAAVQEYAPENMSRIGNASTDWRGAVQRDAFGQEHSVAIAGAGSDMSYRLSLGYLDQAGVVQGSATERMSGALSYTQRLFGDRLNVQANLKGARTDDQFTPIGVLGAATAFAPTLPIRDADGGFYEYGEALAANNPVAEVSLVSDRGTTYRSVGSVEARYRLPFLAGLSTTLRGGFDVTRAERSIFSPTMLQSQIESPTCIAVEEGNSCATGTLERRNPTQNNAVLDVFANYTRTLGRLDSDIDFTAGYSYETSAGESETYIARGLGSDLLGPNGVPSALRVDPFVFVDESKLASGFARLNYTLRDRYLLTLSVRRDGSSRFGPDNRWGTFPAAALAWRVSDEPFMDGVGWLSDFKLRASYGVNGNQAFGNYRYLSTYAIGTNQAQAQFGNEFVTTIRPTAVDPNIKWEETTSYNVGADFGIFERVTGTLDFYRKDTDDLIFNVPVAAGTNLSNFVTTNIGSLRNTGVELGLNAAVLQGGGRRLRWDASFNAAHNRNRLLAISGGGSEQILTGGISGGVGSNIAVLQPDFPVNSFFVYRHKRGADGRPIYSDANGDGSINEADLYEDLNGDGQVNQDDRAAYEDPSADWLVGHSSQFGYRNLDLSFTMRANLGNYVYNNVASNLGNYAALRGGTFSNLDASVLETGFVNPQYFSDVYVEDASYLRMDNLTLGYTFNRLRSLNDLRVFGTVQNVFTLTGYSGVDPAAGLNGIDNNIYPRSRIFSIGATVGF